MVLFLLVLVVLAQSYKAPPCICAGVCSSSDFSPKSKDGAFHYPVFHRKHPCLDPSPINTASVSDAGTVIGNDDIHKGKYFMAINLGTPAVFNRVTIDTGSTLSWVNCQKCQIRCHPQVPEAGHKFDPDNSTTYHHIGCSNQNCIDLHDVHDVPFGCIEETDTCLYSLREDDRFRGYEAGVIGFGDKSYSFFNQMARQTSYNAFAYCFPNDHKAEGFLTVGPYPTKLQLVTPLFRGYGKRWYSHVYSLVLLDMLVDGKRLGSDDQSVVVYTRQKIIVDSGTDDTYLTSPVFYAFDDAMTAAMREKGYVRDYDRKNNMVCFTSSGGAVDWRGLPTVELEFPRAVLKLPPENVFHKQSIDRICLAFQPDVAGVRDVQILGNKAMRSFRVVYDLEKMTFGFQARAC